MTLSSVLSAAGLDRPAVDVEVTVLTADSRRVRPGALFVAVRGGSADGHDHLPDAIARGAVAVVVEDRSRVPTEFRGSVIVIVVARARVALDRLAAAFFGDPAGQLRLVGVTGTNGKTTVVYMIELILTEAGWPTGVLGTIDHHLGARRWPSGLTTPDPVTLQGRLREFVDQGARAAAFEISSHALDQARADSLPLDVGVFTNLSRDHLDYHPDMDAYFAAKEGLFTRLLGRRPGGVAILNHDDPRVRGVQVAPGVRRVFFGESAPDAPIQIGDETLDRTRFKLRVDGEWLEATLPTPGRHNVHNAAAAILSAVALGIAPARAAAAMAGFTGAPGRLERVADPRGRYVFVDYAHTDDALRSVLASLARVRDQRHAGARIITVFGCGGDRDRGKRPLMARAATDGSEVVILTSDNPRFEDPERILDDVAAGVPADWRGELHREVDRARALALALQCANEGDVILVAGKGHEDYQITGDERRPFSDQAVLADLAKD